jgi:sortase A
MMNRLLPTLSRVMLLLGGILILAGLGWGIWVRINQPPAPVISDAGAVVLAETAPPEPTATPTRVAPTATPTPTATLTPTKTAAMEGPTPDLLPEWTITQPLPEPTPTNQPSTPVPLTPTPTPTPTPSPTPSPTSLPPAEEPPTRIVAPSIDLDAKVKPMGWEMVDRTGTLVSEWVVPQKAAGWHMNSALPGHEENVVLSGHHNIEGKVFRYVVDLSIGDEITLYAGDIPYVYEVNEKYILKEYGMPLEVRRKNAQWIMPSGDERLTLVTCWPYEWPGNSHRVIVVAKPATDTGNARDQRIE